MLSTPTQPGSNSGYTGPGRLLANLPGYPESRRESHACGEPAVSVLPERINRATPLTLLIGHLLLPCRPPDIAGFVPAVVVDAVESHALRSRTHISKERREVVEPLRCHANAPPAVVGPARIVRVGRALLGALPCGVLGRLVPVGGMTMLDLIYAPFAWTCSVASPRLGPQAVAIRFAVGRLIRPPFLPVRLAPRSVDDRAMLTSSLSIFSLGFDCSIRDDTPPL